MMQLNSRQSSSGRGAAYQMGAAVKMLLAMLTAAAAVAPLPQTAAAAAAAAVATASRQRDPIDPAAVAASLSDPAVTALNSPALAPLAARAIAGFDALPSQAAAAAAARTRISVSQLRRAVAMDAASLQLEADTGEMRYGCVLDNDSSDDGDYAAGVDHPTDYASDRQQAEAADSLYAAGSSSSSSSTTSSGASADASGDGGVVAGAAAAADRVLGLMPPDAPDPEPSQAFLLHSRPNATRVVVLDFDGHSTTGTAWNKAPCVAGTKCYSASFQYPPTIVTKPFDIDGDPKSFSDEERRRINVVWRAVAGRLFCLLQVVCTERCRGPVREATPT